MCCRKAAALYGRGARSRERQKSCLDWVHVPIPCGAAVTFSSSAHLVFPDSRAALPGDGVGDWTPAVLLQEMPCSTHRRNPQAQVGCPVQGVQAHWYGSGAHRVGEGKERGATQAKKCQKPAPGEAEVCSLLKPRA